MDAFEMCREIVDKLNANMRDDARVALIHLLAALKTRDEQPNALVNHLTRQLGLFPYMASETCSWEDRLALEAFSTEVGEERRKPLHIEQSRLLHDLLSGESVAVSAPTSFGKSFVVDAFIALRRPSRVLIIVPTVALMDETRRRLSRKFGDNYQIVTVASTPDISNRALMVFPQERALSFCERIDNLDLLVVDEFYKASADFDQDRSAALVRAILRLSRVAKQRYFLAPNISGLNENPLTAGMRFTKPDFSTVVLEFHRLYESITGDEEKKRVALAEILKRVKQKTLVYAGSYKQVEAAAEVAESQLQLRESSLLRDFAGWLRENYHPEWLLAAVVERGVGIHTGQLHRALSQLQIRLYEDTDGLSALISTSSIIEGVNTSAQNVVLWSNRNGARALTNFEYKNIVGRGGRMFRHFVGDVYLLEAPPEAVPQQLQLSVPDTLLGLPDMELDAGVADARQQDVSASFRRDMAALLPANALEELQSSGRLQSSDTSLIRVIAREIVASPGQWNCLRFLNSDNPLTWSTALYRVMRLDAAQWGAEYKTVVKFVQVLSGNWHRTIPDMLAELAPDGVGLDLFFKLERTVTFRLSSLIGDVNSIHGKVYPDRGFDISPFVHKLSNAFLPSVVSELEEYGLPRMLARRLQLSSIVNFEADDTTLDSIIAELKAFSRFAPRFFRQRPFEEYIFQHFIEGVSSQRGA